MSVTVSLATGDAGLNLAVRVGQDSYNPDVLDDIVNRAVRAYLDTVAGVYQIEAGLEVDGPLIVEVTE